ncbi:MAG: CvpA family protein [Betaproteobacteria bacterium]|nr:MAG: CvpA family protein [Betaproteobacteria bacterium]
MMTIAVVGLSTALAFWRGFVRVVMSLVAWVAAVVLAIHYSSSIAEMLPEFGGSPTARYIAAFALILVGILVLGTLIGWLLARMIRAIGLGFLDRILGALLGMARGVLIVVIAVLISGCRRQCALGWIIVRQSALGLSRSNKLRWNRQRFCRLGPNKCAESSALSSTRRSTNCCTTGCCCCSTAARTRPAS